MNSLIFPGILAVVIILYVANYNGLVRVRQKVKEAWSGIDVQLKRRYDLIPNLINTVKGYAKHEKELLENVTKARTAAINVPEGDMASQSKAENMLSGTLKSIFALSENYPDLKANQSFLELQKKLTETEDQISASRRIYNGNVQALNTKIEAFPSNIVARVHGFVSGEFFEMDEAEKAAAQKAPEVKF